MSEIPNTNLETSAFQQAEFEQITLLVSSEFQLEESFFENGVPTYYLKQPQETKQA